MQNAKAALVSRAALALPRRYEMGRPFGTHICVPYRVYPYPLCRDGIYAAPNPKPSANGRLIAAPTFFFAAMTCGIGAWRILRYNCRLVTTPSHGFAVPAP